MLFFVPVLSYDSMSFFCFLSWARNFPNLDKIRPFAIFQNEMNFINIFGTEIELEYNMSLVI